MDDILTTLCRRGLVEARACEEVRRLQAEGTPLDEAFVAAGGLPEEEALRLLAQELGMPYADLEDWQPVDGFLAQFPVRVLLKHGLLPLEEKEGCIVVATSRLFDTAGLDELRLVLGKNLTMVLASSAEIARCAKTFLGVGADTVQSLVSDADEQIIQVVDAGSDEAVDLAEGAEDASIIRFVNQVLTQAIGLRATDVHFEPFEGELQIRYRVDGVLQEARIPQEVRRFQAAIVSRLKIISHLDIAEKRRPQDGRIKLKISGREIDVRVSVIPMLHGEAVVLRLLDRSSALLGLEHLGMSPADQDSFESILAMPHGIVLVTGPTGSGKTTTLYAALSRINDVERKIVTIEDPVEYHLHGINQIQVATKAGLTFASGLRAILRHDPDVVLVGEIRDLETAEIAVQASLTGHLVFSTLHTNDAPGALTRLVDMGIEPYLVASSLEAVLAQRLVRVICPECKQALSAADVDQLRAQLGDELPDTELFRGVGCRSCQGTGYRGRIGIMELMMITEDIRSMILERVSAGEIRRVALQQGMKSLRMDGWRHVRAGTTTVEEVRRVTKDEGRNGRR
jgi:general secretion pathway protein E/type IV pilus assembly protein PilB